LYRNLRDQYVIARANLLASSTLQFRSILKFYFTLLFKKDPELNLELLPKHISHPVKIRNHFIDRRGLYEVFWHKYHLPPKDIKLQKNATVLDLGSNIGLTIIHLKNLYPDIKIIGYEMDLDNYLLAKKNTAAYDNVSLYNKAIWVDNEMLSYNSNTAFDAYAVDHTLEPTHAIKNVEGITISKLIKEHKLDRIDYLKMDIEGAEKDILKSKDLYWLNHVEALNIEFHFSDNKTIDEYIEILETHGFCAKKDSKHWSCILATRA